MTSEQKMPELPEVETIVRDLNHKDYCNKQISNVQVYWDRTIATHQPSHFKKQLKTQEIQRISRRGKYIVIDLRSQQSLLIHLRMSGRILSEPHKPRNKHEHVILKFDDDTSLSFFDPRKFGRWYLLEDKEDFFSKKLGPEPFDKKLTPRMFFEKIQKHQRTLKPLLLDQSFIAGLGNIYVDEALWESRLHPLRKSNILTKQESSTLLKSIRLVLKRGINNLGTSLGKADTNYYSVGKRRGRNQDALNIFRRTGEPCPRCKTKIERIIVGQRSTHICPKCQANQVEG